ncbi:MAG: LptF/LptG family permease [Candidatus Paracaedibacteraceae bacterium]|jgi:lipopolysaccharide export system permease protein|nr:LptF/LptG family permease [Candidatus Paracaedibacteraceae bacterium]
MLSYCKSTLNLYFSKLFAIWVASISAIVTFVMVLIDIAEFSRRTVTSSRVSFSEIIHMVILKIPNHIQTLLPFIVLVAAIVSLSRLNRTQEVIVARGFGVSVWQIATGLSVAVLALGFFNIAIINPIASVFSYKQEEIEKRIFSGRDVAITVFEDGLWIRENDKNRRSIISAGRVNPETKVFEDVSFENFDTNYNFIERVDAKSATIKNKSWELVGVTVVPNKSERIKKDKLTFKTDLTFSKIINSNLEPKFISFWALPDYIDVLERSGLSSLPYKMYWHSFMGKIGFMISLIFLAAAFTIRPPRHGYATLLTVLAIASGLVLYFFSDLVYALGLARRLPVLLAVWAPAVTVMLLSATLILHLEES